MGFGVILVGLALLIGVEAGFGVVGYLLIFAGCRKLSRIHDDFNVCACLALLNLPYSLVSGLTLFKILPQGNLAVNCLNVMHFVFSAAMIWYFCIRIRAIAISGDDEKLASSALRNALMSVMYYLWTFLVLVLPFMRNTVMVGILALFKYLLIACGILFLLSCGAKITTPSQIAKENRENSKE
jgi:hypothetical protein